MKRWFIILLCFFSISCSSKTDTAASRFKYNLDAPDFIYELKKPLREISGIEMISDSLLACVQDEKGILFIYDLNLQKITNEIDFEKSGDFEGVAIVNEDAYVLKSNGKLVKVKNYLSETPEVSKIETGLKEEYNSEGLCYDKKNSRLLIACKNTKGKKMRGKKAVFSFDPGSEKLDRHPVFLIDLDEIEDSLFLSLIENVSLKVMKTFSGAGKQGVFGPSGISVHPNSGEIYIVSSRYKLLVVLSPSGKVTHVIPLTHPAFIQPEGITFNSTGTLFISNEGRKGKANILRFQPK